MNNIVKSILKDIDEIYTNFNYVEIKSLVEKCKLLDCKLDNQYFSNLVSNLENNSMYVNSIIECVHIQQDLDIIKLFLNSIVINYSSDDYSNNCSDDYSDN
jgi:hypothetical protein